MDPELSSLSLASKYAGQLPRYTSYPTAVELKIAEEGYLPRALSKHRDATLSLYFHIPFCASLCYFCGCNKVITQEDTAKDQFLDYLEIECRQYKELGVGSSIGQLHLGGGSPSYLSNSQIDRFYSIVAGSFDLSSVKEKSIEADPRTLTVEKAAILAKLGFTRISLGVQDFDPLVQEYINRVQGYELVKTTVEYLRELGFRDINFDLVYGMPGQTLKSIEQTILKVLELQPSRIALYGYAHVTWKTKVQNVFNKLRLPSSEERISFFLLARDLLVSSGYLSVGIDHFCLPGDELAKAFMDGALRRNFMGYTAVYGDGILGLGPSSISDIGGEMFQNFVALEPYYVALSKNRLPIQKAFIRSWDDVVRAYIIEKIMCYGRISFCDIYSRFGNTTDTRAIVDSATLKLQELVQDGLLNIDADGLGASETGKLFLRNIAACFDVYLPEHNASEKKVFSQAV